MRQKIANGINFPYAEMSFTEMSEHSLEKKYNKQYSQVYQRGAVLAWMLDMEIIRLTEGNKNLKDVIFKLSSKYGQDINFNEENFIDEFINEVHPDLRKFFDLYICGHENLDINKSLQNIGLEYFETAKVNKPRHFITDNDVISKITSKGDKIKKVGINEWAGLKKGDIIFSNVYFKYFKSNDEYVPEGTIVNIPVKRGKNMIQLPVKVKYSMQDTKYVLNEIQNKTEEQQAFYNKWIDLIK